MPTVDINYAAVVVAALFSMPIGFVWYGKPLFAKAWMKETGLKEKDLQKGPGIGYALTMVGALLEAYVLAHFIDYAQATTLAEGLTTGLWTWIGFIAYALGVNYIFAQRSFKLWKIDSGYFLVLLLAQGALLALWQ
jgi:hypothetical protein